MVDGLYMGQVNHAYLFTHQAIKNVSSLFTSAMYFWGDKINTDLSSGRNVSCKRCISFLGVFVLGGRRAFDLVVYRGDEKRIVSIAKMRGMASHGMPVCPVTEAAAGAFSNDTDRRRCCDTPFYALPSVGVEFFL